MSTCHYIVGDVRAVLRTLPARSIDFVVTSPPFLLQREYLPMNHAAKGFEIGRESHPAEFIDVLCALMADLDRVLAPHGSIAIELGDTHSGSGGAGGDYAEGGWREGQPAYAGSAAAARHSTAISSAARPGGGFRPNQGAEERGLWSTKKRTLNPPPTWPMAKSLALIPELFRVALAYGRNPLTGEATPCGRYIIRNVVRWVRNNPPVGGDGDKFRRATSDIVIATRNPRRYFDGYAVRVPSSDNTHARTKQGVTSQPNGYKVAPESNKGTLDTLHSGDGTRPLYDWWDIPTYGYEGAHFATFPPALVVPLIKSMTPERVCVVCGKPSERILETTYDPHGDPATHNAEAKASADYAGQQRNQNAQGMEHGRASKVTKMLGWTDCDCPVGGQRGQEAMRPVDRWRAGVVLDPFGGSGTVGSVATGLGRDAVLIDLDSRNVNLAAERIGMFGEFSTHVDVPMLGMTFPVRVPT